MSHLVVSLALGTILGVGLLFLIPRSRVVTISKETPHRGDDVRGVSQGLAMTLNATARQLKMTPTVFIVISAFSGTIAGITVWACSGVVVFSVVAGVFSVTIPRLFAHSARERTRRRILYQWSDVIDTLVSSLRSGSTIPQSLSELRWWGNTFIAAGAAEFQVDYELTGNFDRCLDRLKAKWGDSYADRILELLRVSREVGSRETIVVLIALGAHIRRDVALRQEIDARQGWVRLAARVGLVAPWLVLIIMAAQPTALDAYRTSSGAVIVAIGAVASWAAYRIMVRIGQMKTEQRWLT